MLRFEEEAEVTELIVNLASRRGVSRIDHRQLAIEATLHALAHRGVAGTSLRGVCRDMGVAPSLILRFFPGWPELVAAAYALFTARFTARLSALLVRDFGSQQARLMEILRHYLAPEWSGDHTPDAMISFWQLSRSMAELRQPCNEFLAKREHVIRRALQLLADESGAPFDSKAAARTLVAMLDGLWLQMAVNPGVMTAEAAQELCWNFVCERLSTAGVGLVQPMARRKEGVLF